MSNLQDISFDLPKKTSKAGLFALFIYFLPMALLAIAAAADNKNAEGAAPFWSVILVTAGPFSPLLIWALYNLKKGSWIDLHRRFAYLNNFEFEEIHQADTNNFKPMLDEVDIIVRYVAIPQNGSTVALYNVAQKTHPLESEATDKIDKYGIKLNSLLNKIFFISPYKVISTVMRFPLTTNLPGLVIVPAKQKNRWTAYTGRELKLEGDFSRYFKVYIPEGMQNEALRLLTPDIMAYLIDRAQGFTIEFNNDRLLMYRSGELVRGGDIHLMLETVYKVAGMSSREAFLLQDDALIASHRLKANISKPTLFNNIVTTIAIIFGLLFGIFVYISVFLHEVDKAF